MKKGELITGKVSEIRFPNKGVIKTAEGEVIVRNAITGQTVEARITRKKHGRAEGALVRVLERSPLERQAPCPEFGICGGCAYLSLPYEEQLRIKERQVRELLIQAARESAVFCGSDITGEDTAAGTAAREPVPDIDWMCCEPPAPEDMPLAGDTAGSSAPGQPDSAAAGDQKRIRNIRYPVWFEGILPSPREYGYRNKMEFSFGDSFRDGPLALGMHRRGSFYDIVNADDCVIVDRDYRQIVRTVRQYFADRKVSYFHRLRHTGYLRHLLVRKASGTGEILVDLVTTSQEEHDLTEFRDMLLGLDLEGKIVGILHTVNDAVADVVRDEGTEILFGNSRFTEKILGLQFDVTPFSFFQTNSYGAQLLYKTARQFLLDAGMGRGVVFDLYCGTGTISQMMAPVADKVIGVEIVEEAVAAARENAKRNQIENCRFIAGDVLKVLDEIDERPDLIILDPPRDGVHPKALSKILAYGVESILYISCKPTSLARDLPAFAAAGYRPVRAVCVDQFPWTANVECVTLLQKSNRKPDTKIRIDVPLEDYYRIKDAKKK